MPSAIPAYGAISPGEILTIVVVNLVYFGLMGLLLVKVLRGDFWPPRLLEQYREGEREALDSADEPAEE